MKILSFGAGVNSTTILVLHAQGKYQVDAVVFADTHGEHPETYKFIEELVRPFCKEINLPFHLVSNGDLFADYWKKQIIPFRAFRSCTDRYKIRPIKKFVKEKYGEDVVYALGIDYGERHRAKRYEGLNHEFPLIEMGINRIECKRIIKEFGWQVPIKSGCFFCPFTRKKGWITLLKKHRDLFLRAEDFEKNGRKYPQYYLTQKPLEEIRTSIEKNRELCNWIETEGEPCVFCHS